MKCKLTGLLKLLFLIRNKQRFLYFFPLFPPYVLYLPFPIAVQNWTTSASVSSLTNSFKIYQCIQFRAKNVCTVNKYFYILLKGFFFFLPATLINSSSVILSLPNSKFLYFICIVKGFLECKWDFGYWKLQAQEQVWIFQSKATACSHLFLLHLKKWDFMGIFLS